ncbi:MAG: MCE family protein [Verrucomicrobia bacterium]|nr:MCE family protein [Verrucomicrobiota bacterium]
MNTTIKNLIVGIFILCAISVFVATIMFLRPSVGDGKQIIYVCFSDIGSIREGTRVLFAGRPIGEVVEINQIPDARERPTDGLGRIYSYQLTLHIDSKIKVYNTDEIAMQTSGLLGEKSIGITPKSPPHGVTPKLITDQPIYADSVDIIQNALIEFSELSASMDDTFKGISSWLKGNGEALATTIKAAGNALDQAHIAMAQLNENGTFQNVGSIMESLKEVSHTISKGDGTLGKVLVGDELYLQANAILSKADSLMNDVNHYGVLFHLNKQWQRTRLQKVSQLNALQTPQNFRTYFQNEIDDVNASMARISMLINKAESTQIFQEAQFKKDFAELLRKSNELCENLRLYNQQLNEP